MRRRHVLILLTFLCPLAGAQHKAPEHPSGWTDKAPVTARHWMVAAANPLAVDAGYRILQQGGNAVDAAIAVQLVLGLTEPQSSGLGGGAFMLLHDGRSKKLIAYDGRETAPAAATPTRFMKDGAPLSFYDAVIGGKSVGVPGTVRLLETAHRQHGRMQWAQLFAPAIAIAEQGFAVSPRLHALLAAERYLTQPRAMAYFFGADGKPLPVGTVLRNPAYAATLRRIASGGADAFYRGEIARDIVDTANSHPTNPGDLTQADLANYKVHGARGRVRFVPRLSRLRDAAAFVGRIDRAADAEDARALRPPRDGSGVVLERALHQRSRAPGIRRSRRLRGGSRVLYAARRAARRRLPACDVRR